MTTISAEVERKLLFIPLMIIFTLLLMHVEMLDFQLLRQIRGKGSERRKSLRRKSKKEHRKSTNVQKEHQKSEHRKSPSK